MPRVAAICIDALDRTYLERELAAGRLPNLARLRDRSATVRLDTKVPYRSELVWARFLTGREPLDDKDWAVCVTFDPSEYGIGLNTATTATPFFALGDRKKVVALDLIHSATVDEGVSGVQVVGWGSHSPQWPRSSRPAGLLTEIDRRFGTNPAFGNDFDYGWHDPAFIDALAGACEVGAGRRVDVAEWLLREHPDWDLFLTCISEYHSVGHQLWHGVDERHPLHGRATSDQAARSMAQVSAAVDAAVGRVLDAVGPDTAVVLFAMHGFQPADDLASTVLMPELFQRLHLGERLLRDPDQAAWRRAGCPPVVPSPEEHIGTLIADAFADGPAQRLKRAAKGALPSTAFDWLRKAAGKGAARPSLASMSIACPAECEEITPDALAASSAPPIYEAAAWYRNHWKRMPYFALPSFADGHVRVNLRGRERDGVVDKEDYARTLDAIERTLGELRDARTGEPVVEECLRMREADPMDPEGADADLLVIWNGAPDAFEHPTVGTIGPFPHLRASHHNAEGFAYVSAPGLAPRDLGERPTEDLTPTVLSLLGEAVPAGMRGRSLLDG